MVKLSEIQKKNEESYRIEVTNHIQSRIKTHLPTLSRLKSQGIGTDAYGTVVDKGWYKELTYFIETQIDPIYHKDATPFFVDGLIQIEIDHAPNNPDDIRRANRFSLVKSGTDYEHFVKEELIELGWSVRHVGGAGDQGADLIASIGRYTVVVQCKFYNKLISNKAVQEAVAAKSHYGAQAAIIISNQPLNSSGEKLAKSNDILHFFHDDLLDFDVIYETAAKKFNSAFV